LLLERGGDAEGENPWGLMGLGNEERSGDADSEFCARYEALSKN
jgi:hypothetical protein